MEREACGTEKCCRHRFRGGFYERSSTNKSLFEKAHAAVRRRNANAIKWLNQIVEKDKLDFPVWTLLGTLYLVQEKPEEAEELFDRHRSQPGMRSRWLISAIALSQKKFEEQSIY